VPDRLRVLVTRPEPEAGQWVQALAARHIAAAALPLIAIGPPPDPEALAAAQARLGEYAALMFVSGNAARHFFASNVALALIQKPFEAIKTRVWAPGPGTAAVLGALGVPAARIDQPAADAAQFDSESLWQSVGADLRPGQRVLVVRGGEDGDSAAGSGRDWLSERVRAAGGAVDFVVAYTRGAPEFGPDALALARHGAAPGGPLWLLSSSQALRHLRAALPGQSWAGARALATHPRIAEAARSAGFCQVFECRPALEDVAASIESQA